MEWMEFGCAKEREGILFSKLNRHGFIGGATGTGKTTTVRVLAEHLSEAGIPVFLADIKGDLSGMSIPGEKNEKINERLGRCGLSPDAFSMRGYSVQFWDLFAESGIALRTTISEMGPLLLEKILGLTRAQADLLQVAFRLADDRGLLILDIKDLQSVLHWMQSQKKVLEPQYGHISTQSLSALHRATIRLQAAGGDQFFGEPAFAIDELFQVDEQGEGLIHVLDGTKLMQTPLLYASFMVWILSELYETLPEVGDLDKPKLVFFFDEAYLFFQEMGKEMLDRMNQVIRLIRSKGVGVFFISQSPMDIDPRVLEQLAHRIQHGMLAYTPAQVKNLQKIADGFRDNPDFETLQVLQEIGKGEALFQTLDEQGRIMPCSRLVIDPPHSSFSVLSESQKQEWITTSEAYARYAQSVDRFSAYEALTQELEDHLQEEKIIESDHQGWTDRSEQIRQMKEQREKEANGAPQQSSSARNVRTARSGASANEFSQKVVRSAVNSLASQIGRSLVRGIFGSFKKR